MSANPLEPVATRGDDVATECLAELDVLRSSVDHLELVLGDLDAALAVTRRAGIAIGVLMGRHGVTECEAVALLAEEQARRGRAPLTADLV